jgi:hypothetical protein
MVNRAIHSRIFGKTVGGYALAARASSLAKFPFQGDDCRQNGPDHCRQYANSGTALGTRCANVQRERCRVWKPTKTPKEHAPKMIENSTPAAPMKKLFIAVITILLSGCASPIFDVGRTETVLPLSRAWFEGRMVEYVTTDISDLNMAQMMGANYAPRLKGAISSQPGASLVERVYKFVNGEQISIFQSAPNPTGPENKDKAYSPLWRVAEVKWLVAPGNRTLKSEEELLAAKERGHVSINDTDIVVNCPITRGADNNSLKGVR